MNGSKGAEMNLKKQLTELKAQHNSTIQEVNRLSIIQYKLEGAIEITQEHLDKCTEENCSCVKEEEDAPKKTKK